jgi:hypothetical protein
MTTATPARTQPRPAAQARTASWPLTLALFLFALLPRAVAGRFLTVDEAYHWLDRVERFVQALRAGDFAATNLIGHPGVTTLWLGAAGFAAHEQAVSLGLLAPNDADAQRALMRLPIAAATALCVALVYPLLRRLIDGRAALLATLLIAAEPFLVAHSQLLHLDALLTSFMTLSLLAALAAVERWPRTADQEQTGVRHTPSSLITRRWWLLSGVFGGLALLTKSPAITLLPMVGLIALLGAWQSRERGWMPFLTLTASRVALWCIIAAVTWLALWPAAWGDPLGAVGRVVRQASADGGSPHGWGNYFLGRAVADPGPLFYPVTVAFRLAPWTFVGVILCCVLGLGELVSRWRGSYALSGGRERRGEGAGPLLVLALFVAGFAVAMSLPPKKFDRYALPIFPALDILAAAGLVRLGEVLRRRLADSQRMTKGERTSGSSAAMVHFALWSFVVGLLSFNLAAHHPYHLAYFNPLLGGGPVAARMVPVGWGEGYEQAGAYIAAQHNGADRPAAARYEPVLGPFTPAGAAPLAWWQIPGRVDYAVLYIDQLQRDDKPETFRPLLEREPVYTVRINGIDYAYVYQVAPPVVTALPADFGDAIHLRGYRLDTSALRTSGVITLTLEWEARAAPGTDSMLFAHVFDERGGRVAQVDVPPGGARAPTSTWQPGHYISLVQQIPVPADLPPGTYRVAIGVYDPATFARLPLQAAPRATLPEAGPDALALDPFVVR